MVLNDTFLGKVIGTIPVLPVGGSQPYSTNYTTLASDCGHTFTNTVIATGTDCNNRSVTNSASCTYSKLAVGVAGDTQDPAFCYRITVTNCADVPLTNVTVIDDVYGDLTAHFTGISPVFAAHGTATFSASGARTSASRSARPVSSSVT